MRCNRLIAALIFLAAPLVAARSLAAPETAEQRRQRLESMSADEKEDLLRKKERFEKLSPEEKTRLRQLHEQVSTDPQSDRLKGVMTRYCDWRKTLSAAERAELDGLPPEERVPKIKELMKVQEKKRLNAAMGVQLPAEDLKKIYDWLEDHIKRNEVALTEKLSPNEQRWLHAERDDVKRLRLLRRTLMNQGGGAFLSAVPEIELNQLLTSLKSSEAQKALDVAREPEQKRQLVQRWIWAAVWAQFNPPVSDAELQRFYAEELDSAKREQLELLPREEMQRQLRALYHWTKFRKANEGQRPFGAPPFPGAPGGDGPKEPRPPSGRGFGGGGRGGGPREDGPREGKPREGKPPHPEGDSPDS